MKKLRIDIGDYILLALLIQFVAYYVFGKFDLNEISPLLDLIEDFLFLFNNHEYEDLFLFILFQILFICWLV